MSLDSNSPTDSTQQPGATNVAVLEVQVSNPATIAATLTGLNLTAVGSGFDDTGIASVQIWLDADGNGVVDGSDILLGTGNYPTNNGTAVIAFNTVVAAGGTIRLLVVDNFFSTALDGTYQADINAGGLSGTSASGAVQFTGLPAMGAVITIAHPSETPTSTQTITPLLSATPTVTLMLTATEQPGNDKPVIYPNPSDGSRPVSIHVPGRAGTSNVKVQIFTLAFRLVQQQAFQDMPVGTDVKVDLKDKWGHPLASGLYYVVVTVDGQRTVGKLLVLR